MTTSRQVRISKRSVLPIAKIDFALMLIHVPLVKVTRKHPDGSELVFEFEASDALSMRPLLFDEPQRAITPSPTPAQAPAAVAEADEPEAARPIVIDQEIVTRAQRVVDNLGPGAMRTLRAWTHLPPHTTTEAFVESQGLAPKSLGTSKRGLNRWLGEFNLPIVETQERDGTRYWKMEQSLHEALKHVLPGVH